VLNVRLIYPIADRYVLHKLWSDWHAESLNHAALVFIRSASGLITVTQGWFLQHLIGNFVSTSSANKIMEMARVDHKGGSTTAKNDPFGAKPVLQASVSTSW